MGSMFCGCRVARIFWSSRFDDSGLVVCDKLGEVCYGCRQVDYRDEFTLHSTTTSLNIQIVFCLPVLFSLVTLVSLFSSSSAR